MSAIEDIFKSVFLYFTCKVWMSPKGPIEYFPSIAFGAGVG